MLIKQSFLQLQPVSLSKIAIKEKKIVPVDSQRYRYLRFRAIGNLEITNPCGGFNGNWDGFLYEDFIDDEEGYGYRSFINKRAHHEHNSLIKQKGMLGDLPDAYLNKFIYDNIDFPSDIKTSSIQNNIDPYWLSILEPKYSFLREKILNLPNQRDGAVEVLMRIDTELLKKGDLEFKTQQGLNRLVKMIDTEQKIYCSMGTNVSYSICSSCGNKARFASDYCDHLKRGRKGSLSIVIANQVRDMLDRNILRSEWLKHIVSSKSDINEILNGASNKGVAVRNGEINHKLSFFELSVVGVPAFERADALEKVANKFDGDYEKFLKETRASLGDNTLVDLYSLLQQDGVISSGCEVKW